VSSGIDLSRSISKARAIHLNPVHLAEANFSKEGIGMCISQINEAYLLGE
jgi:hypothetical protein